MILPRLLAQNDESRLVSEATENLLLEGRTIMSLRAWPKVFAIPTVGVIVALLFLFLRGGRLQVMEISPTLTRGASHKVVSPDGSRLAFVSGGNLFVLDLGTGNAKKIYEGPPGGFENRPIWNADGTRLAFKPESVGSDPYPHYRILDLVSDSLIELPPDMVIQWTNSPSVFTGYDSERAAVFSVKDSKVSTISGLDQGAMAVYFDPVGNTIIYRDRGIQNAFGKIDVDSTDARNESAGAILSVTPQGDKIAFRTRGLGTYILEVASWNQEKVLEESAERAQWSPDGTKLAILSNYRNVTIFDTKTGEIRRIKGAFNREIYTVNLDLSFKWTADSRYLRFMYGTMGGYFFFIPSRYFIYDYDVSLKRGRAYSLGPWGDLHAAEWAPDGDGVYYLWVPYLGKGRAVMKGMIP